MKKPQPHVATRTTVAFLCMFFLIGTVYGQHNARQEVKLPDIPGYQVLKCDLHMHTVFSDGNVWPTVRPKEAWLEGLDAFAITDHLEYLPHKNDVTTDFNRSYEIALPGAESRGLILIKGAEITRDMPPGHLNAIFLKDITPLKTEKWEDSVKAAQEQGAFIYWNHPGWRGQQPDGVEKWYDEHTALLEKGLLKGIEIVNGGEYYPLAHRWCLEKNLTMIAGSDAHDPIAISYDLAAGDHRPMTLVLARERTEDAIKEALLSGRTVIYHEDTLIGKPEYLKPFFDNAITVKNPKIMLKPEERRYIQIHNSSQIPYELFLKSPVKELRVPESVTLYADRTVLFSVRRKADDISGTKTFDLLYEVKNLKISPEEGLPVTITLTVTFDKSK